MQSTHGLQFAATVIALHMICDSLQHVLMQTSDERAGTLSSLRRLFLSRAASRPFDTLLIKIAPLSCIFDSIRY